MQKAGEGGNKRREFFPSLSFYKFVAISSFPRSVSSLTILIFAIFTILIYLRDLPSTRRREGINTHRVNGEKNNRKNKHTKTGWANTWGYWVKKRIKESTNKIKNKWKIKINMKDTSVQAKIKRRGTIKTSNKEGRNLQRDLMEKKVRT